VSLAVPGELRFDDTGLVPVVVQDRASGDVLMVAFANAEALARTVETGLAHFWSRSRQALWQKGETSGNTLRVRELRTDCDRDAVLMVADPEGPTCHTGTRSCFGEDTPTLAGVIAELGRVIRERAGADPETSYTARLLSGSIDKVLKKIGEEGAEVVIAAKSESDERLAEEGADLLYHLLLVLARRGLDVTAPLETLRGRRR
jgi:phosphoribosyl-ATP pyrophosphohydrolase/phosphoribosyl-AMP cyclohydrolase